MRQINQVQQSGHTLIETLITMLLIAISVIALIRFQKYLSYDNSLTQQQSKATLLALQKIETLRDFQVLYNTNGYSSYQGITSGTSTTTAENATYNLSWTVTTNTSPAYKTIDVTVSWTDQYSTLQSIRLVTIVSSLDPSTSSSIM